MRRAALALVAVSASLSFPTRPAHAVRPDQASEASKAQVARALSSLAPGLAHAGRQRAPFSPGSLEAAISAYAPLRPWAVDEGVLAPVRADGACPPEMAPVLGRFCVDRYEASLEEKTTAGLSPHSPYDVPERGKVYVARSVAGVVPQAYVSAEVAGAACRAAGKRLCAAVEWRLACGGTQGTAYPYGPIRQKGACNDAGVAPMMVLHRDKQKTGFDVPSMNDPRLNQLANTVAKTGAFAACVNDVGAFDMVGNLHEWTADPNGTFQGGYYLDTHEHGDGCAYRTIAHGASYHDYSTGFRCCKDLGDALP
jgi:hypothetical protein